MNRMLTFCYLAAFNWWLVLCPSTLSHDWQMGSIPLLTSISDPRNLLTLWAFASTILMIHKSLLDFEVGIELIYSTTENAFKFNLNFADRQSI